MTPPLINVTLPAFNEEAQVAENTRKVVAFLAGQPSSRWEILIADNGSTDRTWAIAQELAANGASEASTAVSVRARHLDAAGRGGAIKAAWLASNADILSYMDVDLSTDLSCLPALLAAITEGGADLAVGSRLLPASRTTRGWKREVLSRGYSRLIRRALGLRVRDAQCGFKAIRREAARVLLPQVQDSGWFFDTELLVRAQRAGYRVAEVPVRWVDDPGSTVKLLPTIGRDLKGVWRLRREAG